MGSISASFPVPKRIKAIPARLTNITSICYIAEIFSPTERALIGYFGVT